MTLNSPLTELKGVGEALSQKLGLLNIQTIGDLIDYYPRRYDDYSNITAIKNLKPGPVSIEVNIKQAAGRYVRRGMHITEAVASDKSGSVRLVWFNQPYRAASLKAGQSYYVSGQYELSRGRFSILNPSIELISEFPVNTARIIPVYRETKGVSSRQIRQTLKQALPLIKTLPETLPPWVLKEQNLISRATSLEALHFPQSTDSLETARRRLGFEEIFALSLASLLNKQDNQGEKSVAVKFKKQLAQDFVAGLPFKLTDSQRSAVWQIYLDLQKTTPMNRLVEGDVGAGKTVVGAMAAMMVMAEGWQAALMAPTELLARQHAQTLHELLKPLKMQDKVVLLTGSQKPAQKAKARAAIASGKAGFIVGTHALIQEKVDMHKLALVVIDEQHRFGVEQRKALMAKAGHMPHVLSLTATPIPRSLALTLYGELDVTLLAEKPPGRQEVDTEIIAPSSRTSLYKKIDQELEAGGQMFVVCPLITESEVSDVNSAEKIYQQLKTKDFKHRRVGLLHGKLKAAEKQRAMEDFLNRKTDILVATTVVEVGVDVPNASIMLIESAERFGLAQLHQLRGRVGRSTRKSHCYLMLSDAKAPTRRLSAMAGTQNGFKLAELDLELRGPGAIYGTLQHGRLDLRIARLNDIHLIKSARAQAEVFISKNENLLHYKQLHATVKRLQAVTNLN